MTVGKAISIVLGSIVVCGVGGAAVGYGLGKIAPQYYRSVFPSHDPSQFDPVQVGIGLGLTQGVVVGIVLGSVVTLAVTWFELRSKETVGS